MTSSSFDVVVLAGGTGARLGGVDKGALLVGGRTLLDGVLLASAGARTSVVVGVSRPVDREVMWAREDPPGGGPLAGLAAGVAALPPGSSDVVVVLAVDLPFVESSHVSILLTELDASGADVAAYSSGGRAQLLTAAYRASSLAAALAVIGDPHDAPVRLLLRELRIHEVTGGDVSVDCDTPEQLAAARARLGREG